MITRWISLVPSQIRSTRSSRKWRAAGLSSHVAAPAEHLHRPVGDPAGRLRGEELRHRDLAVDDLAIGQRVEGVGGVVGQQPRRVQLGQRVGEREGDALVVGDPRPERLALLRPRAREVEQPQGRAAAARRDEQPLDEDPLLRARVAARRDAVRLGHAAVAELELGVVVEIRVVQEARRAHDLEPRRAGLDEEELLLALPRRPRRRRRRDRPRS